MSKSLGSLLVLAIGAGLVITFQPFSMKTVEPGEAGLKIQLYGGDDSRGIENAKVISGGRVWINKYTEQLVTFPTVQTEYQFTNKADQYSAEAQGLKFTTRGTDFGESVAVLLQWKTSDLSKYYATHKLSPKEFIQGTFYSTLNACYTDSVENFQNEDGSIGVEPVDYLNLRGSVASDAKDCVQAAFPYVEVLRLNVFDTPVYPDSLAKAIENRNKALQEQQTAEAQKETAEAKAAAALAEAEGKNAIRVSNAKAEAKVAAEKAKAANDPNYLNLISLENESARIDVERVRAEKWNGQEVAGTIVQTDNAQVATPSAK